MNFVGKSLALSAEGLDHVSQLLSVGIGEICAILAVETRSSGFLLSRKPQILFERHIFSGLTRGQHDATHPEVSNPVAGGYGAGGEHQYVRLAEAMILNEDAALMSASWGMGQVMGENFKMAGYPNVKTMVSEMSDSEDAQLSAVGNYILSKKLTAALAAHDWAAVARGYNGSKFAINQYDVKLKAAFEKFQIDGVPDFEVRAAQMYLQFKGIGPISISGILDPMTRAALSTFQTSLGLPVSGKLDDATLRNLLPA